MYELRPVQWAVSMMRIRALAVAFLLFSFQAAAAKQCFEAESACRSIQCEVTHDSPQMPLETAKLIRTQKLVEQAKKEKNRQLRIEKLKEANRIYSSYQSTMESDCRPSILFQSAQVLLLLGEDIQAYSLLEKLQCYGVEDDLSCTSDVFPEAPNVRAKLKEMRATGIQLPTGIASDSITLTDKSGKKVSFATLGDGILVVPPGSYKLSINDGDFEAVREREVTVTKGSRAEQHVWPAPAKVTVEASPPGAFVSLYGGSFSYSPKNGETEDITPGRYKFIVSAKGYETYETEVELRSKQVFTETVTLTPKPTILVFHQVPAGAEVVLIFPNSEKRIVREADFEGLEVAPGTYQVEIRRPGRSPFTQQLKVEPRQENALYISPPPEPEPCSWCETAVQLEGGLDLFLVFPPDEKVGLGIAGDIAVAGSFGRLWEWAGGYRLTPGYHGPKLVGRLYPARSETGSAFGLYAGGGFLGAHRDDVGELPRQLGSVLTGVRLVGRNSEVYSVSAEVGTEFFPGQGVPAVVGGQIGLQWIIAGWGEELGR